METEKGGGLGRKINKEIGENGEIIKKKKKQVGERRDKQEKAI